MYLKYCIYVLETIKVIVTIRYLHCCQKTIMSLRSHLFSCNIKCMSTLPSLLASSFHVKSSFSPMHLKKLRYFSLVFNSRLWIITSSMKYFIPFRYNLCWFSIICICSMVTTPFASSLGSRGVMFCLHMISYCDLSFFI